MKTNIINGKVILENEVVTKNILIEDGTIISIDESIDDNAIIVDAEGMYISPGFIDVHVHGKDGYDTMNATYEAINTISMANLKTGVTGFLPTTMTQSLPATQDALKCIKDAQNEVTGAKLLGVHMEGPFFNKLFKGAQVEEYIINPSVSKFKDMVANYEEIVKLVSLAPEMDGAKELTKYLVSKNIVVSIGHTGATYEEGKGIIELGANHFTHTFNAMSAFNHRQPGIVGLAFNEEDSYAELILDGYHVNYEAAKVLLKLKTIDKLVLITDSMEACMKPPGKYQLGGQDVFVDEHTARLASGTLAGSILCMNHAVKNAIDHLGLAIHEAVKIASLTPAKSINMDNEIGSIAVGKKADLIIFNDNIDIKYVIIDGEIKLEER